MPTEREREYYRMGYQDGIKTGQIPERSVQKKLSLRKPKRKLSAWNKYVKANSKKPRFRYRNGKLNLKKMAVAFRKSNKRGGKR